MSTLSNVSLQRRRSQGVSKKCWDRSIFCPPNFILYFRYVKKAPKWTDLHVKFQKFSVGIAHGPHTGEGALFPDRSLQHSTLCTSIPHSAPFALKWIWIDATVTVWNNCLSLIMCIIVVNACQLLWVDCSEKWNCIWWQLQSVDSIFAETPVSLILARLQQHEMYGLQSYYFRNHLLFCSES